MAGDLLRCLAVQLLVVLVVARAQAVEPSDFERENSHHDIENITLYPGNTHTLTLHGGEHYQFLVNMTNSWSSYSSFVFQIHTQQYNITVRNGSDCSSVECKTTGRDVGMVQLWTDKSSVFSFYVNVECPLENVTVFVAVVGVPRGDPIPGGCSMTSYIEIDAQLQSQFTTYTTTVEFQDSNQGFYPPESPPICDGGAEPSIRNLEYRLYHRCLGAFDFDGDDLFDAIMDMMTPHLIEHHELLYVSLDYNTIKKVVFDSTQGQGVVYNVIAFDKDSGAASAYIPMATYACNISSTGEDSCHPTLETLSIVGALIVGVIGLFLCYFAHRFFHVEIFVFSFLIFLFLWYLSLEAGTDWSNETNIGWSIGLAIVMATLLFTLWFFTGWYYLFVILFGAVKGFIVMATLLYTPLGTLSPLLMINYVYFLLLACGMVVFMIPLVAFPRALNIFSSSFVGGYAVIFCVGMVIHSSVVKVVLKVVKNATIPSFLHTEIDCPFQATDIVLLCAWFVLVVSGVIVQSITSAIHQRNFQRREREMDNHLRQRYVPFPKSPFKQIREYLSRKRERGLVVHFPDEQQPLLSPNSLPINRASHFD